MNHMELVMLQHENRVRDEGRRMGFDGDAWLELERRWRKGEAFAEAALKMIREKHRLGELTPTVVLQLLLTCDESRTKVMNMVIEHYSHVPLPMVVVQG